MRTLFASSLALALAMAAGFPGAARASDRHPFDVRDLVMLQRISDPVASPDGSRAAFVLRSTDLEANRGTTDIWMVDLAGGEPRPLTSSPQSESNPRWAPDGKSLYFVSTRSGSSQIWVLPLDGGEARRVTSLPVDVDSFALSADGTKLLFSAEVFPDCDTLACTRERLDAESKKKTTGRVYEQLFFRHWDTWKDGRRSHLFAMSLDGGEPVDLMKGMEADCPSKPWGGPEEYTFTPDGKAAVFSARAEGRREAWSTNFDLWLVPLDGSKPPARITEANRAWDTGPVFSPDGRWLAYRAMKTPDYEADRFRIMLRAWPEGPEREVAPRWDRSPHDLLWSADGKTLFATADNLGNKSLFAIDVATGQARELVKNGYNSSPTLAGDRILFAHDNLRLPAELFTVQAQGGTPTQITHVNAERLSKVLFGEPEQFTFKGARGKTVYGWVVKPAQFTPGKKYPIAFLIHGGPQGSFGDHFHYRWNPQTYAGRGYAVVTVDFTGSTGYGKEFQDAIRGDWGGKPLEDLQKGLKAAIDKYPFLDGNRACALGASYGGYMINWIAGKWPDRFRCLVSHDGNLDEHAAYFNTEELWFPEHEHGGTPWDNPSGYQKHNPVNYVKNWKTPILVIHGARDYRVVDTQGMSTFTAAQRRGIPSKFLYFPDENHWVLKPHNSIQWHDTVLDWLDQWTGNTPSIPRPRLEPGAGASPGAVRPAAPAKAERQRYEGD